MKKRSAKNTFVIEGVALTGPSIYTADELRSTYTKLAMMIWPTVRNEEEAKQRIDRWLRHDRQLDDESIARLPAFAILGWLEEMASKCVSRDTPPIHPYKAFFAEFVAKHPDYLYPEAEAAKEFWNTRLSKSEIKERCDGRTREEAMKSFVRSFKYVLKK